MQPPDDVAAAGRTYRGSVRLLVPITVTASVGVVALLLPLIDVTWMGTTEKLATAGTAVGLIGGLLIRAWLSATVITPDRILARGLLSTRRLAWRDIQDIRIEHNPGALISPDAPVENVVAYRRDGRSLTLPHLNRRHPGLAGRGLDTEVDAIVRAWVRHRGADWRPIPQVRRKAEEKARNGFGSWTSGLIAWAVAMVIMICVALVAFPSGIAHTAPAPLSWLLDPLAALVVPPLAFAVGWSTSAVRRRRSRHESSGR